jgi:hypothetical protein
MCRAGVTGRRSDQARRVPMSGLGHGRVRGLLGTGVVVGRLAQSGRRVVGEPDELPRHLELAVLTAQSFELEPKHVSRRAGEIAAEHGSGRTADQPSQSPSHHRQR